MQGAGLTPLDFAIYLLRMGGHLGREEEALRSIGYSSAAARNSDGNDFIGNNFYSQSSDSSAVANPHDIATNDSTSAMNEITSTRPSSSAEHQRRRDRKVHSTAPPKLQARSTILPIRPLSLLGKASEKRKLHGEAGRVEAADNGELGVINAAKAFDGVRMMVKTSSEPSEWHRCM